MATKRQEKLEVECEWASCGFRGHTMEAMSVHMSQHLKDYLGDHAGEELDEYACLWDGCEFLSMGSPRELEIHALFHNYHSKLVYAGSQLLKQRPDLPSCTLGPHSNNLVPEGSEGFVCQWEHCDSSFNNPEWFYRHVDNHVESSEPQSLNEPQQQQALFCHWTGCDAFFKIRYRLREHVRTHTQEKLVACPTCGSMFSSNTKLFDHLHRQAEPVEALVCEHCGKAFSRERLLRDHVRQHVNQVKCPLCDMTCPTLAALKIHIRFRHCDERPFPCDFCDKRFKNQRDLQKHTEIHNECSVYQCTVEGCDYACHTFQTMNHHFKRVHEAGGMSKYKCHICDKVFSWCYTLTLHLRKKHELKWPSGHSRFRYKKDIDGFLKVNMVRFETVEVTKEIMKNMAKKPQSARRGPQAGPSGTKPSAPPESSPAGSSSPSSSSSSYSSQLSGDEDMSPQASPHDSPMYCVMNTVPPLEEEPGHLPQDDYSGSGRSGAVQALTEVARGLGMDVV